MAPNTSAVLGVPGVVRLAGRELVVPQPTPADVARVHDHMRRLAQAGCVSPLDFVSAHRDKLDPGTYAESLRAAVLLGSGGGVEPTREAVLRTYDTLEGVRFRLFYAARKGDPAVTREWVNDHVTEDNLYDVSDALAAATDPGLDPKKVPPSGPKTSSPSPGPS